MYTTLLALWHLVLTFLSHPVLSIYVTICSVIGQVVSGYCDTLDNEIHGEVSPHIAHF